MGSSGINADHEDGKEECSGSNEMKAKHDFSEDDVTMIHGTVQVNDNVEKEGINESVSEIDIDNDDANETTGNEGINTRKGDEDKEIDDYVIDEKVLDNLQAAPSNRKESSSDYDEENQNNE